MFLLPYRQTEISSPHLPDVVAERLRQRTLACQPWFRSLQGRSFDFTGSVSLDQFRLMPVIRGRNSYQPWLVGHVSPRSDGSTIRLVETFHPVQAVIIVAFFACAGLVVCHGVLPVVILFLFFHCPMYFLGFLPEAKRAEERLRELTA